MGAAVVRFWGIRFGLPYVEARPDEPMLAGPALFTLLGHFRPGTFYYPTLYIYALGLVDFIYYAVTLPFAHWASLAAFVASRYQPSSPFLILDRGLSAVAGTLTVWVVYALGRRLFDDAVARVAALLLALSFLHVRDSHFGVTDVAMTALITLAVVCIVRWQQTGRLRDAVLAGVVGGLAMATKYNGLGVCVPFAVAVGLRFSSAPQPRRRALPRLAAATVAYTLAFAAAFIAAFPYIVTAWTQVRADTAAMGAQLANGHVLTMPRGWWYHAMVTLPIAVGWPVYVAALAGAIGLLFRPRQGWTLLAFPIAYYLVAGSGHADFARYMVPEVPFLAMMAAWALVTAVRVAARAATPLAQRWIMAGVACLAVAPSARRVMRFDRVLARTDSRIVAANTALSLIPPGSIVYQSGGRYGAMPFGLGQRELSVHLRGWADGRFTPPGGSLPDWIILQQSPLVMYSGVPGDLAPVLWGHYRIAAVVTAAEPRPGRVYDQQDAFFLPLAGFAGVRRPGPNFVFYRLKPRAGVD